MTNRYIYVPDLVQDMAECDANYLRLRRLFPNMDAEDDVRFGVKGQMENGATVTIEITERCPFTTMLLVRVDSDEDKPFIRWPSLQIRMYHDVKSVAFLHISPYISLSFVNLLVVCIIVFHQ